MKKIISIITAVLICFSCLGIVSFAKQSDTVPAGYIGVYNIADLYCIRNDLTANYILMNDIDLTEDTAEGGDWDYGGRGWDPIGNNGKYEDDAFSGIFDGNGYSITGLSIRITEIPVTNENCYYYFGLFSAVSGTVKNLTIDGTISTNHSTYSKKDKFFIGSIAGACYDGKIENCISKVNFKISENYRYAGTASPELTVGGIAGKIRNTVITGCINAGSMSVKMWSATDASAKIGGIIGMADLLSYSSTVEECINTADIYCLSANTRGCDVNSYASGIGYCNPRLDKAYNLNITNCFNTGNISMEKSGSASGVASRIKNTANGIGRSAVISYCYNIGTMNAENESNAISASAGQDTAKSYFLKGTGNNKVANFGELSASQMKLQSMYYGWDFNNVWTMSGRPDYNYPELRSVALILPSDANHQHEYIPEITAPATHLSEGVMTHSCICGVFYTESIEKIATHNYSAVVTPPTCTEKGYTTYTCECGDSYIDNYVKENGHSHTSEITTPATHLKEGVMTFTCACGDTYTEAIEKTAAHDYTSVITTPATHLKEGVMTYTCACGDTYTEAIEKTATHDYSSVITTSPTHLKEGVMTFTCACGDTYTEAIEKIAAHDYSSVITTPATHIKEGVMTYTCACGDTYTEAIEKIAAHNHSAIVTPPSCIEKGYTTYTCECGDSYKADYIDAAHGKSEWVVVTQAQIGIDGLEQLKCTICGEVLEEKIIPATEPDCIIGDANNDGKITAADARLILRISAQLENENDFIRAVIDFNNDGKITAADARRVLRKSAQLE